LDNGC
jgi:hypothetical protein